MPRKKSQPGLDGGAKISERGLAGYLREKYYFGAEGTPSYSLYEFLSAVVHSPNTKPMPNHPYSSLLVGNEADADRALDALVRAKGWQRYVVKNSKWGGEQQGFSVVPQVAPSASASAPPSGYVAPSAPWSSVSRGAKRGLDPAGGVAEEEPPPAPASSGLSQQMARLGDDDEDIGEAVEEAQALPSAVAQAEAPTEPPKPSAKKSKKEKKKEEEVDFEAEAQKSKIDFFRDIKNKWENTKGADGKTMSELNDERASLQRVVKKALRDRDALNKRVSAYETTLKEGEEPDKKIMEAFRKEMDGLDNIGLPANQRALEITKIIDKRPENKLIKTLRERGLLDEYNAWLDTPEAEGKGRYRGKGARPANNVLHQIATEAYKGNPTKGVGQFRLLSATPTLKFYKSGNTVIVGIRGTVPSDMEDVKADGLISLNRLETSNRYRKDLNELKRVKSALPTDDFYGVGHSLGGAILDAFLHTGMLKSGVSYNPAVQPKDFQSNVPNHRIYQKGDPLLALGKNFLKNAPEVREAKPMSWSERLISLVPYAGKVYNYLNAHNLSNFTGGKKTGGAIIDSDATGLPQKVIDMLPKSPYYRSRAIAEWKLKNVAGYAEKRGYTKEVREAEKEYNRKQQEEWAKREADPQYQELQALRKEKEERERQESFNRPSALDELMASWRNTTVDRHNQALEQRNKNPFNIINKGLRTVADIGSQIIPMPKLVKDAYMATRPDDDEPLEQTTAEEIMMRRKALEEEAKEKSDAFDATPEGQALLAKQQADFENKNNVWNANQYSQKAQIEAIAGMGKFAESPTPSNPLSREEYLKRARASAKRHGLPYKLLGYADDNKHKLQIPDPDGKIIRFGRKGYGDFIIWSALEASGKVAKGMAEKKKYVFHKSHSKIKGDWRQNAFSPNNLALKVLW